MRGEVWLRWLGRLLPPGLAPILDTHERVEPALQKQLWELEASVPFVLFVGQRGGTFWRASGSALVLGSMLSIRPATCFLPDVVPRYCSRDLLVPASRPVAARKLL